MAVMFPFLSSLSKAARASWPFIRGGVRRGLSSRVIGTKLRKYGYHVANDTLLDLMRWEGKLIAESADLRFLRLDARPKVSRMLDALTPIRKRFSYGVRVRGYITGTTTPVERWVTVVSDENLTRRIIEQEAREAIEVSRERYGLDVVGAQLTSALKAVGRGLL